MDAISTISCLRNPLAVKHFYMIALFFSETQHHAMNEVLKDDQ